MELETGAASGASTAGSKKRAALVYAGALIPAVALMFLIFNLGRHLHAPRPAGGSAQTPAGSTTDNVMWKLLLASIVIILVARLVGMLFRRINQPQVVGEIVAGVLLGPSVLGAFWPHASSWLFSPKVLPFINVLAEIGLIFFMFLIGLELDVRLIRGRGHAAVTVSGVSIVVPFLMGAGIAVVLFPELGSAKGKFVPFALFLGASMSITAFPVLARILTERGLSKTRLGAVSLTCAAINDLAAWCVLAAIVAVARSSGAASALVTICLSAAFIALMVFVVRPLLARLATYHEEQGHLGGGMLVLVFGGVLIAALATDRIGIHAIFGAFLFGAVMPQRTEFVHELVGKLEDFVALVLLPLFFAYTGLRTRIGLIGGDPKLWLFCGLILLVAVAGKWGGSALAARGIGLRWREAHSLGVLMNTRGLTELIILNIGLDLGVIPPVLFAMLVIMALVTTFMTTPLLSLFYSREQQEKMAREEGGEEEEGVTRWRVLIPIAGKDEGHELVHTALRLARDREEEPELILLRVVRLPGSTYRAGPLTVEHLVERATEGLRPLVQLVEGAGASAVPLVVPARSPSEAIAQVANQRQPDLVLVGWRRSTFGRRLLGGSVGEVLRSAKADVAILVDPARHGLALRKGSRIAVPHGGGFHEDVGLDLALRLAEASGAEVTLVGPADEKGAQELAERAADAYEETGVWTVAAPVEGDVRGRLVEEANEADLVVMGVSDSWVRDQHSLGELRESVAARASAPLLIVRRHGQRGQRGPSKWLRRQREWMDETSSDTAEEAAEALTA